MQPAPITAENQPKEVDDSKDSFSESLDAITDEGVKTVTSISKFVNLLLLLKLLVKRLLRW